MQLDSRRQGSAKDYVVQELIHDIVNIKLKPGEKLCEPALCERFGVSRTPFREAELELAQRKLIVVRPKIGTFVSFIDKGTGRGSAPFKKRSGSGACGDGMLYADKKRY